MRVLLQIDHLKHNQHPLLLPLVMYLMSHQTDSSPAQTSANLLITSITYPPRPSPTTTIPDSNPETSGESSWRIIAENVSLKQRLPRKSFSKKHRVHKESVSKQGRKFAKGESSVQIDPLFDAIPEDTVDHMETENAQDEGRTREMVDEDKEIDENILSTEDVLSADKEGVSTDMEKVSIDRLSTEEKNKGTEEHIEATEQQYESTDGQRKGTEDHVEEEIATQLTQTPTSTIFGDDETIAKFFHMRKKKIEEEDESESESDGIPEAEKKFKQLESDEEMARKIHIRWEYRLLAEKLQEQEREQFTIEERVKFLHDTIAAQRKFLTQQRIRVPSGT
ncbi:hypothetical protein Tco_1523427 [Tanacetum coccineum]